ncbi:MAG: SPFH domain-containing protein [Eubacteriales bacterium]|nr:SPFH domain-containing protein [Eubacteriales bacterium]
MGLFSGQLANVVEWEEYRDDMIFWKWTNKEIKKGSKLVIRPGQDAIFLYNGKIEGIFKDEGEFDIESQIIPFLSTLKGFKFGFNSGMRAEVLFVNTKEFNVRWGTKNPISIPTQSLPGGMPVRSFGNFVFKVNDYISLIDKVAGVKQMYVVDDIKERVIAVLDQLLMKWISKEGKDMFNLQANAYDIANGIKQDLDMQISKLGIEITDFNIESFSYPEEIAKMQSKAASQSMVGDMNKYTQMAMADNLGSGKGSNIAGDMMNIQMGMAIGQQMMNNMNMGNNQAASNGSVKSSGGAIPKFCPNCGTPTNGANFCGNCGNKLS